MKKRFETRVDEIVFDEFRTRAALAGLTLSAAIEHVMANGKLPKPRGRKTAAGK